MVERLVLSEKVLFCRFPAFRQHSLTPYSAYMMCTLLQNKILSVRCSLAGESKPYSSLVHWKIASLSLAHVRYQSVNCR